MKQGGPTVRIDHSNRPGMTLPPGTEIIRAIASIRPHYRAFLRYCGMRLVRGVASSCFMVLVPGLIHMVRLSVASHLPLLVSRIGMAP